MCILIVWRPRQWKKNWVQSGCTPLSCRPTPDVCHVYRRMIGWPSAPSRASIQILGPLLYFLRAFLVCYQNLRPNQNSVRVMNPPCGRLHCASDRKPCVLGVLDDRLAKQLAASASIMGDWVGCRPLAVAALASGHLAL